ncbi:MAG TPA: TldD/PmbA family protein [Thermodesulfobacteriota bacterium]
MKARAPADIVAAVARRLAGRGAAAFEIYFESARSIEVEVKGGEVERTQAANEAGVALRVLVDGRAGFASTTRLDATGLERAVDRALAGAKVATPDPTMRFAPPAAPEPIDAEDPALASRTQAERIDAARRLEAAAFAADRRVARVRGATYREEWREVYLATSEGFAGGHRSSRVSASLEAAAEEGALAEAAWEYAVAPRLDGLDVEAVGREAGRRAAALLGAVVPPTGRGPAILDRAVACDLLEVLAESFTADAVQKGRSLLAARRVAPGAPLLSPLLTLVDDGRDTRAGRGAPFDDEGVPTGRTVLVEGGRFAGLLYDARTAAREGRRSTGNGVRDGLAGPPSVGVTTIRIEPGHLSPEALAARMGEGLLVTEVLGMHTADPVTGDFSVGASGFLVAGGERGRPVRGLALAGNLVDLLGRVTAVGNDVRVGASTAAPSLLVDELAVSGG